MREHVVEQLDLRELLIGDINRLRYVKRFGRSLTVHQENDAEHSFYVTMYSLFLTQWTMDNVPDVEPNRERILIAALIHDLDEAFTGDFPRDFKYSDPQMKVELDRVAGKAVERIFRQTYGLSGAAHTCMFSDTMARRWQYAKDETVEGCIVAFADFLAVLAFLAQEARTSNTTMIECYVTLGAYLGKFDSHWFDFLRPIITETAQIVEEIMGEFNR
jgi:5'-deoxynucleotidase YfbR-like HD superfamily hydrolase